MENPWIILDRDGVINRDSSEYIKSESEWIPEDGSIEAIAMLCKRGYKIAVATNQSGLARGLFDQPTLDAMHRKMCELVDAAGGKISAITYCPHGPDDNCNCRKPKIGLLEQLRDNHGVILNGTPLVGDSLRDLQSGHSAGCTPVLVRTGKGSKTETQLDSIPELANTSIFNSLADFAQWQCQRKD